jgi:TP901 family phage tail tape measure protein
VGAAASLYVDVRANVSSATAALKKTEAQFLSTGAAAKKMDAAMMASAATTTTAGKRMATSSAATAKGAAAATAATSRMGKASATAGAAMRGLGVSSGTAAAGGVAAFAYGLAKSVKSAADFDSAMRNVNSIAGLSETQFQSMKRSVLGLSGPTAQAPQTLAEGMYQLVSSGFDASDSLKIIKSSAIAATAGLTDTETATTAVAGTLNAYRLKASDAQQVSDDLFQTVNVGVLSFEQLAQGIGPVLPFAAKLGVSLKQVGAMTASLTKAGIPAAEAFTYQKGVMTQLVKPSEALSKAFRNLGVRDGGQLIRQSGSLQAALSRLYKSVGGDSQKFAKLFPDIRGMSAAFSVTGRGARGASADLAQFNNTAGKTAQVFAEQKKGDAFGFRQLRTEIQQTAIMFGSKLSPTVRTGASAMGTALRGVRSEIGQMVIGKATRSIATAIFGGPIAMTLSQIGMARSAIRGLRSDGAKLSDIGFGKQTGLDGKKYNVKIDVDNKSALSKTAGTKRGLDSIPGVKTTKIRVTSDADIVSTKIRTALTRAAKPIKIKTEFDRRGNASTVVTQAKPIKVTADTSAARAKATQFVQTVNGLKPKSVPVKANNHQATAAINQTIQDLARIPATKNVDINVRTHKTTGKASGGAASGLVEVNERGPESARLPGGQIAMLGDGRRQVMALPNGSYVYTAAQTARMFGDIPHLKGGGKGPRRKKREKMSDYRSRYNAWVNRLSGIKDSGTDRKIASVPLIPDGSGGLMANQIAGDKFNLSRANRHLSEAKRMKGPERREAIARARAEIAQAKQQLALDQAQAAQAQKDKEIAAQESLVAALNAQAEAIKANTDEMTKTRKLAESLHTATKGVTDTLIQGIFDKTVGGQLSTWMLTSGARTAT